MISQSDTRIIKIQFFSVFYLQWYFLLITVWRGWVVSFLSSPAVLGPNPINSLFASYTYLLLSNLPIRYIIAFKSSHLLNLLLLLFFFFSLCKFPFFSLSSIDSLLVYILSPLLCFRSTSIFSIACDVFLQSLPETDLLWFRCFVYSFVNQYSVQFLNLFAFALHRSVMDSSEVLFFLIWPNRLCLSLKW